MNLVKLFEMQKVLDERIEKEHPRQDGEDRLAKKILALQVELGELANEWRGFKFWSKDQEPRRETTHFGFADPGGPFQYKKHPLLEEYVDCLHFILSIGLEYAGSCVYDWSYNANKKTNIDTQFIELFFSLKDFHGNGLLEDTIELFLGLGEMLGFTWEQIEKTYISKNEVNHERQNNNY